ncbi:hypothetical protein AA0X95_13530 [Bacillus sp. 1P10SD]|uniref:hypothetical protein n=1 Tax=Bacillus sp. 1P10SD TaxID=3132265 RepID=UPI0039A45D5F
MKKVKGVKGMSFPFLALCLIHICLLGITFYKNKNRKNIFVLLVSNMGFAYLFEYFVFNVFKGYKYKPNIVRNKFFDSIFGAVLSQAIFVPFTSVFLTATNSGWLKKLLASVYFSLVELLFLRLGVYKHTWWKTIYTFIMIPVYFKLSDIWYHFILKKNKIVQFISFFLMIMVTETNLFLPLALFRKFRFGSGRYHTWREHFILSPLYSILVSLFTAFSLRKNNNLSVKVRVILFSVFINRFFVRLKFLKNNLTFIQYLLIRFVMGVVYGRYREWVYGEVEEKPIINNHQ